MKRIAPAGANPLRALSRMQSTACPSGSHLNLSTMKEKEAKQKAAYATRQVFLLLNNEGFYKKNNSFSLWQTTASKCRPQAQASPGILTITNQK